MVAAHSEASLPLPLLALLGFAAWTLLLIFMVGWHRWSGILTGRARIASFSSTAAEGPDWYRRAMRAHANCVENLPVFGAVTLVAAALGIRDATIDALALAVLVARVGQSTTHVAFEQTNLVVSFRFAFFFIQLVAMLAIGISIPAAMR